VANRKTDVVPSVLRSAGTKIWDIGAVLQHSKSMRPGLDATLLGAGDYYTEPAPGNEHLPGALGVEPAGMAAASGFWDTHAGKVTQLGAVEMRAIESFSYHGAALRKGADMYEASDDVSAEDFRMQAYVDKPAHMSWRKYYNTARYRHSLEYRFNKAQEREHG
jgi:hypothetical protein